ncbi:MAG: hypothetical protein C6Y22_23585, partial [Hapalosiphonaceae cyanobacterium JJU2]
MNMFLPSGNQEIQTILKKILVTSLRIREPERRTFCIDIGLDPSNLPFLTGGSEKSFSKELINYLFKQNKKNSLCLLCKELEKEIGIENIKEEFKNDFINFKEEFCN